MTTVVDPIKVVLRIPVQTLKDENNLGQKMYEEYNRIKINKNNEPS